MQTQTNQQNKPIPLIQFQGERFKLTEQAKNFLKNLEGPLGVITIVGKYRTGKSLFLNKVLLNNTDSFKVCPTINSCTKGLWISRKIIKSQYPQANDMDVIVIDTQGFGAMQQTDAYNNRILLFALLLSSYFIYNSVGSIDEKSLNNLNVITNLAKQLQTKNISHDKIQQEFPTFMWVVRDFTLRLVDTNGCLMEPKQYLQFALEIQKGISDAVQNKNKIRRMIKHFFKQRDCYTLVTPVQNQSQLQKLNTLNDSVLRPEFLQQIQILRQKILRRVKPKRLKGRKLTGQTFLQLASSYIESINNGSLPNIQSAWKSINSFEINSTLNKTKQLIQKRSRQFIQNIKSEESFIELQKQFLNQSINFMKKKISSQTDLQQSLNAIKQFITQTIAASKLQNKKKSLDIIINSFHQKYEQFGYLQSFDQLQKKWKNLQHLYKTQFKQNPSLQQFMLQNLYPLKLQNFSSLIKRQCQTAKTQQSQKQLMKQNYEKKIKQQQQLRRQLQSKFYETERQMFLIKVKVDEEQKIKQMQLNYVQKQFNQTKQELERQCNKNEILNAQLKQKQMEITQLKIKANSLGIGLKQSDDDRGFVKKQMEILKSNLSFKAKQIEELKNLNQQLRTQIKRLQQRQKSTNTHIKYQMQIKSQEYKDLLSKFENLQKQNMNLNQKASKLQYTLQFQSNRIAKQQKIYQTMLQTLKNNYEIDKKHNMQLIEANKNMAFALKHLEQRFQQAEQKQKKLKQYKRCVKNSSCLQCQSCFKLFVPAIFPQHLNVCILSSENLKRNQGNKPKSSSLELQIFVKQTLLKDSDSKPYTQYVLQVKKGQKSWSINRKYKQFCSLHSQLKTMLPGVNFSDFSYIVNPQQGSKKSMPVEQRRKILEKYLRDLSSNPHIAQETIWKQFIEDIDTQSMTPLVIQKNTLDKMAMSDLLKSSQNKLLNENSPQKQNCFDTNKQQHKTPEQFLRIWNQRNLRAKQISKVKMGKI